MAIKLTDMKLLQFVDMFMSDKMVVDLFRSLGSRPNRRMPLVHTNFLAEINSIFKLF